jgi:signal transduction histidine kinase
MTPTISVLYAEDSFQDADQTRAHFTEHAPEFAFEIVETGQQCLDRLKEDEFDLVLLDNRLPDMDGMEVLTQLIRTRFQTPVVMVTGVGDEELVAKSLRLGAINYVPKQGAYLETLPELLHSVLREHRRRKDLGLLAALPRRILYVEHHPMDIELTLRHFAEAAPHFVVDVVPSCTEALTRLEQYPACDLVLVDLRMPDQSGLEFIRRAKRCHFPLPPFIIVSGKGDEATAIATLRLGAADYITKREGYLDQLVYMIEHAIAFDKLNRLEEELRVEIDERKRAEDLQRHAAEAALAASLAKSEFIANMSHELRTPLNAIIGFTEGLLTRTDQHPLDEYQRDRLTKVKNSSDHLLTLVNGVLDLAAIDSGRTEVHPTSFDIGATARELEATAKALLQDNPEVRFALDIEEDLPPIVSDRDMVWQILSNLISNAVHATVRGSIALRVRYNPRAHTMRLSVDDTGVGIREEDRERILERFYQASNMPYRSVRGTGLGLAISRDYAELLGGSLTLQSDVGRGSTFTLCLPLVHEEEQKEEPLLARC